MQVARLDLYWGGPLGVAKRRPAHPTSPADPAYDWSLYDPVVQQLSAAGIKVLFSIYGTPAWANGGKGLNVAPRNPLDLKKFAHAAALRYSGTYEAGGVELPAVRYWLAWNEPNNPVFLRPQFQQVGSRWVIASAKAYAQDLQRRLQRRPRDRDRLRACGLRRDRSPREQPADEQPPVGLAARLPRAR